MGRIVNALSDPQRVVLKVWRALGTASFQSRLDFDLLERPHYAYCLANAARLARALHIPRISAIEFGVAGGRGLLALEALAGPVEEAYGVKIETWGFDTGEGLPAPVDYRDLPYIWQKGFFTMDQDALQKRLNRSQLVLGNVSESVPTFVKRHHPAPFGAVLFDLDFWSSTRDALALFTSDSAAMLPRVFCYFDDVISKDGGGIYCEDIGQLRAIRDYNEISDMRKLRQISGLVSTRRVKAVWNSQIYVHHAFDHPLYCTYIHDQPDRQLQL